MTCYFVQRYNAAVQKLGTSNIKKQNSDDTGIPLISKMHQMRAWRIWCELSRLNRGCLDRCFLKKK